MKNNRTLSVIISTITAIMMTIIMINGAG
ncbi:hypothetical protein CGSHi22121_09530 [Haemophilus influenzae 22.1-21]|uniref:Uncharacterized protein n=2 Tax=Haemophilus influenzae TaxID=727 RepID=A5UFQ2_HAEIG|nr:hypothetical protein CGSHiGG_03005 [Haemophilus influenzae PittGG]EDJ88258.1 hypothetical protein CGSHi22121_09530 [Haemophilus influenzae 22.1-21]EDJ90401.1 hypothetical protein CGSHi22421_01627 [Haemophilus influenzae R3021]EDK09092.1 hypothetical protein CGSHiHH_02991 [Haemophilus influenzae PittHH]